MRKIRVLLADDHAVLRAGLRALINAEPDMEIVAEAANLPELEERALSSAPDVVVLDINMPGGDGVSIVKRACSALPAARILILTMHDELAFAQAALTAGANGYVVKTVDASELLLAVRVVHQGRNFVDVGHGEIQGEPTGKDAKLHRQSDTDALLSDREQQVLYLLADGYTNKEIATQLDVSIKSVETYRARAMQKLHLRSRADIIRYMRTV